MTQSQLQIQRNAYQHSKDIFQKYSHPQILWNHRRPEELKPSQARRSKLETSQFLTLNYKAVVTKIIWCL